MLEMRLLPHVQGKTVHTLTDELVNGYSQGMLAMGIHRLHEAGFVGKGKKVGIIDSGIDYTHPDLKDRVKQRRDYVNDGALPDAFAAHGCASGDTYVYTSFCGVETMEVLWGRLGGADKAEVVCNNINTLSVNPQTGSVERCQIEKMFRFPVNESIVVAKAQDGTTLKLTPWHPTFVLRDNGIAEVRADELVTGDLLLAPLKTVPIADDYRDHNGMVITEDIAWVLGAVLGNGTLNIRPEYNTFRIEMSDPDMNVQDKFLKTLGPLGTKTGGPDFYPGRAPRSLVYGRNLVEAVSEICGVKNKKDHAIRVPSLISKSPLTVIAAFIAGYLDTDGSIRKDKAEIVFSTISRPMVSTFVVLLQALGIRTGVTVCTHRANEQPCYQIRVGFDGTQRLVPLVRPYMVKTHKVQRADKILANIRTQRTQAKRTFGDVVTKEITSVERQDFKGFFYDFSVGRLHNYVAGIDGLSFIHNTHVAGIVGANGRMIGTAPECELLDYRVLDSHGSGSWQNVAKAIMDADADGCDVINLSLGGPGDIPALHEAVITFVRKAPCIVACGNEGPETISYPAYYPEVIAVGAGELGADGVWRRAYFSTTNPEVDVMAPGYNVLSTIPNGNYMYMSGTSMGAPHVTGFAACLLQRGQARLGRAMTEPAIWEALKCGTVDIESIGIDAASGAGFVTIYPAWRKPVEVQVTEGRNVARVDGVEQELVPGYPQAIAETRNGFFSLPMAFVARVLGGSKAWNATTRTGTFTIPRQ